MITIGSWLRRALVAAGTGALGYAAGHVGQVISNPTILGIVTAVIGLVAHELPSPAQAAQASGASTPQMSVKR